MRGKIGRRLSTEVLFIFLGGLGLAGQRGRSLVRERPALLIPFRAGGDGGGALPGAARGRLGMARVERPEAMRRARRAPELANGRRRTLFFFFFGIFFFHGTFLICFSEHFSIKYFLLF